MRTKRSPTFATAGLAVATILAVAARILGEWFPGWAVLLLLTVVLGAGLTVLGQRELLRRRAQAWAASAGWTAVARDDRLWPWQGLQLHGEVRVERAWTRDVDGFAVTTGEIRWTGGALSGAVLPRHGKGAFVVVRLPRAVPDMAVRLPYRFVGDWPRQTEPEVRQAFLDGRIPPWTVREGELFTIEPQDGLFLDPDVLDRAVRRALLAVRMLELDLLD
ncbi:hypothetical protein OHA21_04740 [Actinoplanes sp. NBC_00393]|uniref:hypothetical protein n=1 Tax=Actinoplanes sp. NBC_00393 TaxID=2975953 RepID=UPI002E1F5F8F